MLCAIWNHLYNCTDLKNTHGGVILLIKLQACTKSRKVYQILINYNLHFIYNTLFIKVDNHHLKKHTTKYNTIISYSNANKNMYMLIKVTSHHKKFNGNKLKLTLSEVN